MWNGLPSAPLKSIVRSWPSCRTTSSPPSIGRREHDDQRRDHPVELLAVAMRQEEAARLVEQQVVEVALQLLLLQPELLLDLGDRLREEPLPIGVRQREAVRLHPPDAPDARIDEGLLALAVGGLVAMLHQLLRLLGREGQADRPQPLDLQPGQHGGSTAADAEGARGDRSCPTPGRAFPEFPRALDHPRAVPEIDAPAKDRHRSTYFSPWAESMDRVRSKLEA